MELQKIEILINKYLESETSLEEEKQLRAYFTSENVAPRFKEYQVLFGFFEAEQHRVLEKPIRTNDLKKRYSWLAVAACIAVIIGVFLFKPVPQQDLGTIEDPEIALQKTKETLHLIAQQMQTGKKELVYLTEIEKTKEKLIGEN